MTSKSKQLNLSAPVHPIDFALIFVVSLGLQIPLFRPTFWQVVLAYGVHFAVSAVFTVVHHRVLHARHPEFRLVTPDIDESAIAAMSDDQRLNVLSTAIRYPVLNAWWTTALNFIVVIPSLLIITFAWNRQGSYLSQFAMAAMISMLSFVYFHIANIVHSHLFLSRRIREIHDNIDLSGALRRIDIPKGGSDFDRTEIAALIYLGIASMTLSAAVWYRHSAWALEEMLLVSTATLVIYARMWNLGRRYFWDGIATITAAVSNTDPSRPIRLLPVHTVPGLAQLDVAFNDLSDRNTSYQRELNHWIGRQAEESRLNAMGEIAGLVVHDLASPLHVIRMCATRLSEPTDDAGATKLRDALRSSTDQALALVLSLRSYLRHDPDTLSVTLGDALDNVRRILRARFHAYGYERIRWIEQPDMRTLEVAVNPAELMQIMDNVIANSV